MRIRADAADHQLMAAKIVQMLGDLQRQRVAATRELASIVAARAAGQREERPRSDQAEAARNRALEILNGHAPEGLRLVAPGSREAVLEIEVAALDLAMNALSQRELAARAVEAAALVREHGPKWAALCRELVLTATRLEELERRAHAWPDQMRGSEPATLLLATFIGTGRSILNIPWANDPLSRLRTAALAAGILDKGDIKE